MQYKDIEIFLDLVSSKNISKTSENLFMAQSVISTRLKKLEEELGYVLFIRNKGIREIELTKQGSEFISLANRLRALYDEASNLKESSNATLRIGAPESIFLSILDPIITSIRKSYPALKIYCNMIDSFGVYEMMESNRIDFGFASYESSHRDIIHKHFYTQSFCLVMSSPSEHPISPDELNPSSEILFSGGNFSSLDMWRAEHFPSNTSASMSFNSSLLLGKYIKEFNAWAILPVEVAKNLVIQHGVSICELTSSPESRKIYFLSRNSKASQTDAGLIFMEELSKYERH